MRQNSGKSIWWLSSFLWAVPDLFLFIFAYSNTVLHQKNLWASRIRTQIVESEHADHHGPWSSSYQINEL